RMWGMYCFETGRCRILLTVFSFAAREHGAARWAAHIGRFAKTFCKDFRASPLLPVAFDECVIDLTRDDCGVVDDFTMERDGRVNPLDAELGQGAAHGGQCVGAGGLMYQ